MCLVLIQGILLVSLPMLGSCATRSVHSVSFDKWRRLCNCSCLGEVTSAKRFRKQNCTREEIFKIDEEGNLYKSNARYNLLNLTPGKLACSTNVRGNEKFQFFLIKLKCTRRGSSNNSNKENIYAIYRKRRLSKSSSNDEILQAERPSTSSTENPEKRDTSGKPSSGFVIGLSVGLGLFTALVVCLICICCHRRKKTAKKEPDQPNEYIDEGEDSSPYRILDLSTNISCDSSGYTFLEASKRDEENAYQKLVAPPSNKTEKTISCLKKEDIELAEADEPVYFLLEGKPAANCS